MFPGMGLTFSFLILLLAATLQASVVPVKKFEQIAEQAETARTTDRVNDAIDLYTEGVHLKPTWSEGWWWLGSLLYDQDRFSEAEAPFRRFLSLTPKPGPAYAFLGLCEYETNDYDGALKHFRTWAQRGWAGTPDLIDVAVFHFALLLTQEGRFVEALYLLATEAGKSRSSPGLAEAMGLASLRMKNIPENYSSEQREMVWLAGEAALYASLPSYEFDRANDYSHRLLVHYGQQPNVHYFCGTLYGLQHKSAEAEVEFKEELRISPHHVPAMLELASIDVETNQLPEASSLAERAIEIEPINPVAHQLRGRVLLATERFQESVRELEIAKQLAPDSAPIRSHLAMAYRQLGRKKDAEREAAAFLSLTNKGEGLAPPYEKTKSSEQRGQPK
jgi:tetratricopeptide (TPR) repeat protein